MADNVGYSPGSGATVAADDVTGVLYQRVKITLGADGVAAGDVPGDVTHGLFVSGAVAHDGVDAGNPLKVGGKANDSAPTQVSAQADRVDAWFDRRGALFTRLTDSSGAAIATGVQYVENAVITADAGQGTLVIARRDDALSTLVPSADDAVGLRVGDKGALWVQISDGAGAQITSFGGGTQYVGDAAATATPTGTMSVGLANASAPTAVSANNDAVAAWFLTNGIQNIRLVDSTGAAQMASPVALGDSVSNPTTAPVGAFLQLWDSGATSWARWKNAQSTGDGAAGQQAAVVALSAWNGGSFDRTRTIEALNASPNTDTGIPPSGTGPGWDRKQNPAGVAATSTANAVTIVVNGADFIALQVTAIGTTPGSMIIECESDDATWSTAGMVVKLASGPDVRVEGSFVPAVGDIYLVRTGGHRRIRYRVNAVYASGTATIKYTGVSGVGMIKSLDMGGPPHNFGYALVGVTAQYTTAQTSVTIGPTVAAGQRMVVTYVQIQAGGTVAGTQVTLYFGTGAYTRGTSKTVFDGEFAPSATLKPGVVLSPPVPFTGAADEELKITNVGAINPLTVTIWYYLVAA